MMSWIPDLCCNCSFGIRYLRRMPSIERSMARYVLLSLYADFSDSGLIFQMVHRSNLCISVFRVFDFLCLFFFLLVSTNLFYNISIKIDVIVFSLHHFNFSFCFYVSLASHVESETHFKK